MKLLSSTNLLIHFLRMQGNQGLTDPLVKRRKVVVCEGCIRLQIKLIKTEEKLDSTKKKLEKKLTKQAMEIKSLRLKIKSQEKENKALTDRNCTVIICSYYFL